MNTSERLDRLPRIPADRFRVLEVLGQGGMGVVLKASHAKINKTVAIKVLNSRMVDEVTIKRFQLEGCASGQLSHPNLVSVFDYDYTEDEEPYMVMEFVDGKSLQAFLELEGRLSNKVFLHVFGQLCKALQYIHSNNIIHRDIKTSNIMLQIIGTDLYAKLLDFGIARVLADNENRRSQQLTETGAIIGSPYYMSPEQCMGNQTDARSDIYSLGCVMYECISGRRPVEGENALQTFFAHINGTLKPLEGLNSQDPIDRSIAILIHKCLEKDPAQRFQSSTVLLRDLTAITEIEGADRLLANLPGGRRTNFGMNQVMSSTSVNRWKKSDQEELPEPKILERSSPSLVVPQEPQLKLPSRSDSSSGEYHRIAAAREELKKSTEDLPRLRGALADSSSSVRKFPVGIYVAASLLLLLLAGGIYLSMPAISESYKDYLARVDLELGEHAFSQGPEHWNDARSRYVGALERAQAKKNDSLCGKIHDRLGRIDLCARHLKDAEKRFNRALELLDKRKIEDRGLLLDATLGKAETLTKQGRLKDAERVLASASDLAAMFSVDPEKLGEIREAMASNAADRQQLKDAVDRYDQAITEYSKLKDPPPEKFARAWLRSAQVCQRLSLLPEQLSWIPQATRRAQQAIVAASKISDARAKDEIVKQAEPLTKMNQVAAAPKEPAAPIFGLPGVMQMVPPGMVMPPGTPMPPGMVPLPGGMPSSTSPQDFQAMLRLQQRQVQAAQAANEAIVRAQEQNYAKVREQLEHLNRSFPSSSR